MRAAAATRLLRKLFDAPSAACGVDAVMHLVSRREIVGDGNRGLPPQPPTPPDSRQRQLRDADVISDGRKLKRSSLVPPPFPSVRPIGVWKLPPVRLPGPTDRPTSGRAAAAASVG
jgi:hypothetical protein